MGSVGVEEDASVKGAVEAFLQRCAPSGDAAYAELRALLARLHDPATRRDARVFLAALRRRQQSSSDDHEDFFRRFGFRIQELLLHDNPATASAFLSVSPAELPLESLRMLSSSKHHSSLFEARGRVNYSRSESMSRVQRDGRKNEH